MTEIAEPEVPVEETPHPGEVLDKLVSPRKDVLVEFGKGDYAQAWVQKPLSFFNKMDFFACVGKALDNALKSGLSVDVLIEAADGVDIDDDMKADAFAQAIVKLVQEAPEVLPELFCIVLGVPRSKREATKVIMELPEDEGGISDEQGFEIIDTFVEQNGALMRDFFRDRIAPRIQKMRNRRAEDGSAQ
jgi:hypothetical protein